MSQPGNLNWYLLIFKALILAASVEGGIPSLAAAPAGPETRPLVSASAFSMISRSVRGSVAALEVSTGSTTERGGDVALESHDSSTERTSPKVRITDLSITFWSSRMLPGQL